MSFLSKLLCIPFGYFSDAADSSTEETICAHSTVLVSLLIHEFQSDPDSVPNLYHVITVASSSITLIAISSIVHDLLIFPWLLITFSFYLQ